MENGVGDDETAQLRALQAGIAQGMTLIDTAEMYGDGVRTTNCKAIAGQKDSVRRFKGAAGRKQAWNNQG
jgi:aryl-alcohol dehydrogenase-like predicted oxidoreductase